MCAEEAVTEDLQAYPRPPLLLWDPSEAVPGRRHREATDSAGNPLSMKNVTCLASENRAADVTSDNPHNAKRAIDGHVSRWQGHPELSLPST